MDAHCNYRIRFSPDASREQLRGALTDLIVLLHSERVWPSPLYPTGVTKKLAMRKSYDLTRRDAVERLVEKIIGTRGWPEIVGGRYWSDTGEEDGEDRFVLNFSGSAAFGAKWHNMVLVEHSHRFAAGFRRVIDKLGEVASAPFVVLVLDRDKPGEIVEVTTGNGEWLDAKKSSRAVQALIQRTEK